MMAHITYLSVEGMELKFDRARRNPDAGMTMGSDYEVEHYLDHQAAIFLERFDPGTYLYLSRVMDYYDPFSRRLRAHPGRPLPARLVLLGLALRDRALAVHRARARGPRRRGGHHVVESPWGHDSFLMDVPEYHEHVRGFLYQDDDGVL